MDIAFHYFAVKAMAISAGFSKEDAQFIAEYSQMVDDFDYTKYWHCTNVPDYVKQDGFDIYNKYTRFLNPVQTGFLVDGHIINIDYALFLSSRFQRLTCAPFHFLYHDRSEIGKTSYRVVPSFYRDLSIISSLMDKARDDYLRAEQGESDIYGNNATFRRKALMKIGLVLHIFADSVAHQLFSGFNDDVNKVELTSVIDNSTGTDETKKYKDMILAFLSQFKIIPKIGHMLIKHVPDLTHLTFGFKYKNEHASVINYTRNNTDDFITRCRDILNYLRSCKLLNKISDDEWRKISDPLTRCFKKDISIYDREKEIVNILIPIWTGEFKMEFNFDREKIKKNYALKTEPLRNDVMMQLQDIPEEYRPTLTTTASQDFYLFNVCAEEVLVNLYGNNPRRLIGDELLYPNMPVNKES